MSTKRTTDRRKYVKFNPRNSSSLELTDLQSPFEKIPPISGGCHGIQARSIVRAST